MKCHHFAVSGCKLEKWPRNFLFYPCPFAMWFYSSSHWKICIIYFSNPWIYIGHVTCGGWWAICKHGASRDLERLTVAFPVDALGLLQLTRGQAQDCWRRRDLKDRVSPIIPAVPGKAITNQPASTNPPASGRGMNEPCQDQLSLYQTRRTA